jgi:hypothetical protein
LLRYLLHISDKIIVRISIITYTWGIRERFCGGLPAVNKAPLIEFPLLSTTSVIGIEIGGFSEHVLWYETTQNRDSKRSFRYAIWRNKVTYGGG